MMVPPPTSDPSQTLGLSSCGHQYFAAKEGRSVSVHEVANGLSCNCVCPGCSARLIARQGKKRAWHFAHYMADERIGCLETALHRMAKQILQERGEVQVPDPNNRSLGQIVKAQLVELEVDMGCLRPDVVFHVEDKSSGELRALFIEIAVTHLVDEVKQAQLKEHGWPSLEIRLDRPHLLYNRQAVEQAVIHEIRNKHWLHNEKIRPSPNHQPYQTPRPKPIPPRYDLAYDDLATISDKAMRIRKEHNRWVRPIVLEVDGTSRVVTKVDYCPQGKGETVTVNSRPMFLTAVEHDCIDCDSYRGFAGRVDKIVCFGRTGIPDWYRDYLSFWAAQRVGGLDSSSDK